MSRFQYSLIRIFTYFVIFTVILSPFIVDHSVTKVMSIALILGTITSLLKQLPTDVEFDD